jgi:hypothetical protein
MAGTLIVSNITTDTDNTFIVRSNTGTTLFSANTTGIDTANSIATNAITSDKILSVANTKISGNIVSSQIAPDLTLNGNVSQTGTGFTKIAVGTTAQRPTSNVAGYTRFNTTTGVAEYYDGTTWRNFNYGGVTPTVTYLVVAGGGAGGQSSNGTGSGGGGAGGLLTGALAVTAGTHIYSNSWFWCNSVGCSRNCSPWC